MSGFGIGEAVIAATLVVMVDGTAIQTPIDNYVECENAVKVLKKQDRDAFCIPRRKEMDRVRDMMWDFMDVIDAIRDRDTNKCGGPSGLRDDEKFPEGFEGRERCGQNGPNQLCPKFNGVLGKDL